MVCAMGVIRGCTEAWQMYFPDPFGIARIQAAQSALPDIAAAPGPKAILFGSSMVDFGFAPEVFDARLAESGIEMTSYNYGIGNMNPNLQLVLARRLRAEFEARGERVDLMLVEFNPFQATEKRRRWNAPIHEAILSVVSPPRELWSQLFNDPERGVRLFTIKYLRDGMTAEANTMGLGYGVEAIADLLGLDDSDEMRSEEYRRVLDEREEMGMELFWRAREEMPDVGPGDWSLKTRGAAPRPEALSPETVDLLARLMKNLQYPESRRADLEDRIRCCDVLDLHFDEGLVRDFIAMVRELGAISDRIEVVLLPKNYDWVRNPPEALARQQAVLERIERETGARVSDYQYRPEIDERYFWDVTHLTIYEGQDRFTTLLADDWAARF
jgi:hypothetical protein